MKTKLIILFFFLACINNTLGQVLTEAQDESPQKLYDFHISKKKTNNTAAWVVLGGGIAMIVGGIAINVSSGILDGDNTNNNEGLWLTYLGGASTLVSLPLFSAGAKHKKKAKIQLQNGAVGFGNKVDYTGISIGFSF